MASQYLLFGLKYKQENKIFRAHLFKILYRQLNIFTDIRTSLANLSQDSMFHEIPNVLIKKQSIISSIKYQFKFNFQECKDNGEKWQKISNVFDALYILTHTWYHRYWKLTLEDVYNDWHLDNIIKQTFKKANSDNICDKQCFSFLIEYLDVFVPFEIWLKNTKIEQENLSKEIILDLLDNSQSVEDRQDVATIVRSMFATDDSDNSDDDSDSDDDSECLLYQVD